MFFEKEENFFISGEIHYFRTPKTEWNKRLQLLKDAGASCVATYVPWLVHEPKEGCILFGDCPERDLRSFLQLVQENGFSVILRPGPYQYSELFDSGIPHWLIDNYPQVLARNIDGEITGRSPSYLHPTFMKYARRYFHEFCNQIRPYLKTNGGPVSMIQLDNEMAGPQLWGSSLDYNPDVYGFGEKDGRYVKWLCKKYQDVGELNYWYESNYSSFLDVHPCKAGSTSSLGDKRNARDFFNCYLDTIGEYANTLATWLNDEKIDVPYCLNSANSDMLPLFRQMNPQPDKIDVGVDLYYGIGPRSSRNNPTPQYVLRMMRATDLLNELNMRPISLEFQSGTFADTPPILYADQFAHCMVNLAMGIKGWNYYIFTGGPNFEESGTTGQVYDFGAPISADGTVTEKYAALQAVNQFIKQNEWLSSSQRCTSVQIGFDWETLKNANDIQVLGTETQTVSALEEGVAYTLISSRFHPQYVALDKKLDTEKPLIVVADKNISKVAQYGVVHFAESGGKVLILQTIPDMNEDFHPCTILGDYIGHYVLRKSTRVAPFIYFYGKRMYGFERKEAFSTIPDGAKIVATDGLSGEIVGFQKNNITVLCGKWHFSFFHQAEALEHYLTLLGAKPIASSSNRNILVFLQKDCSGHSVAFLMNLFSGPQASEITFYLPNHQVKKERVELSAMEVKTIALQ